MAESEIRHSITIAAPIDTVWAEITKVGARQRAQLDAVLETSFRPGDPLYYKSEDGTRVFMVGRVLECDPPTTFSHTQVLTMRDDPLTVVTWHLEAVAQGTRVTLVNSGWPAGAKMDKVDTHMEGHPGQPQVRRGDRGRHRPAEGDPVLHAHVHVHDAVDDQDRERHRPGLTPR